MALLIGTLLAYALGCVLGGDVMRRLTGGASLRDSGSGNIGATNALRSRGWKFALGVLLVDVGKGVLAVLALPALKLPGIAVLPTACLPFVYGCAAVLGHCFPPQAGFRGGKGVATAAGATLALLPAVAPWMLGAFVLVILLTGYASLASLMAAAVVALWVACVSGIGAWSPAGVFALASLALLLFKHRENLARLIAGTESRFERARVLGRALDRLRD